MFTFMLGALGGAALGGSYVLLNTPRSGKENRYAVKNYVETARYNVENVQDKTADVQNAVENLKTEINLLQWDTVPDIMESVDEFTTEATVYTRRINDEISVINGEVEDMNARIEAQKDSAKASE